MIRPALLLIFTLLLNPLLSELTFADGNRRHWNHHDDHDRNGRHDHRDHGDDNEDCNEDHDGDGDHDDDDHHHGDHDHDNGHGHGHHDKITVCHVTPYGGVVINVDDSSWDAHESHGDTIIPDGSGYEQGDGCDPTPQCYTYWTDVDGDGLGDPASAMEFCGTPDPGYELPSSVPDLCPGYWGQVSNKGCPLE